MRLLTMLEDESAWRAGSCGFELTGALHCLVLILVGPETHSTES